MKWACMDFKNAGACVVIYFGGACWDKQHRLFTHLSGKGTGGYSHNHFQCVPSNHGQKGGMLVDGWMTYTEYMSLAKWLPGSSILPADCPATATHACQWYLPCLVYLPLHRP